MTDNWRWIEMISEDVEFDYTGKYRIYIDGKVESVKRKGVKQRFLKESADTSGYKQVELYKDNKGKTYLIHRLVAIHFIPNPHKFLVIDHENQRKDDNSIDNLRWCSPGINNRNRLLKRPKHDLPRGVSMTSSGKYRGRIRINGKLKHLGCYETIEEASIVYEEATLEQITNGVNNIHC